MAARRRVSLKAALAGGIRSASYDGRDYAVVPVVALVEGVIFASNAETPELVLAEEFSKVPDGWNGRPVCWDHPSLNGHQVSANSPVVLERMAFGQVFGAKVEGKKLKLEAWIDLEKTERVAEAKACLERIRAGETVEVSVGAFVDTEQRTGSWGGKRYAGVWRGIVPDHLALLPEGTIGACSVEMGCGTPRAARRGEMKKAFKELLAAFQARHAAEEYDEDKEKDEKEGESDSAMRMMLHDALFAAEPAFLGVVDVFPDASQVVYATAPEGEMLYFRRGYEAADGKVTLAGEAEEVRMTTHYEPVTASAGCGCGGKRREEPNPAPEKETTMKDANAKKLERIKAVIASGKTPFVEADAETLAALPEERIAALEAHCAGTPAPKADPPAAPPAPAAEAKPKTEEEYLADAPDSVKQIVASHKAATAKRKADAIALIAASSHRDVFTKEQLEAKDADELERLARMATASAKADNAGRGLPRTDPEPAAAPAPISLSERIKAAAARKGAA